MRRECRTNCLNLCGRADIKKSTKEWIREEIYHYSRLVDILQRENKVETNLSLEGGIFIWEGGGGVVEKLMRELIRVRSESKKLFFFLGAQGSEGYGVMDRDYPFVNAFQGHF